MTDTQPAGTPAADPYATWDPSRATDLPDGLPDRAIVPLVEALRARGIVTLQSCAGHQGSGDGTLWVRADSVDGAHVRLFLVGEPFDRVQYVHWPEPRWEFIWHPERTEQVMRVLGALLPAGTPAADQPINATSLREWERQAAEQDRRREWAAAYRSVADGLTVEGYGELHGMVTGLADAIESGVLAPWADRPEPRLSGPDTCQIPGEDGSPVCVRHWQQRPCRTCPGVPEPSTPPAEPAHTAPAAAGPHPDTLDGPGVLGRVLLYADGSVGRILDEAVDAWRRVHPKAKRFPKPWREVLLVDPAAGRVLERAIARVAHIHKSSAKPGGVRPEVWADEDELELIAAVDALDGDQPTANLAAASRGLATELAPEPHSGPGWDRGRIRHLALWLESGCPPPSKPVTEAADLRALLADRDRWAKVSGKWADETIAARNAADAARAELAEVTADRDRLREHSTTLNTIGWKLATALGDAPEGAERIEGNPLEQAERLIAERDRLRGAMPEGITGYHVHQPDGIDRIYNPADVIVMIRKETDQ